MWHCIVALLEHQIIPLLLEFRKYVMCCMRVTSASSFTLPLTQPPLRPLQVLVLQGGLRWQRPGGGCDQARWPRHDGAV